jgi:hypothetical protein
MEDLCNNMLQNQNFLCPMDITYQTYTCAALFRGPFSASTADDHLAKLRETKHFAEWIPSCTISSVCSKSVSNIPSVTLLANSKSTKLYLRKISDQFAQMQYKRAYFHWFEREGMDIMELVEAGSNMNDLISEYEDCCGCCFDCEDVEEEE